MNSEYCKQALAKVGNPNVLINLVSRRVRQLNSGGGGSSRPLITDVQNLGAGDIALLELVEDKMSWDLPVAPTQADTSLVRKKRKSR